ncbi:hypothetical protein AX768_02240 [Burkholderia sp. PAMC 28687]|jgi:hypothetical protein|nr:hypothetical protein AX768_02240 [Burkholderia sp. PAMC 28687]
MLPKTRKKLRMDQTPPVGQEYPFAIAVALHQELGGSRRAIKTLTRWTGASDRTAQNWLSATRGPSGADLMILAKHSHAVHFACLALSGRADVEARDVNASVALIEEALSLLSGRR